MTEPRGTIIRVVVRESGPRTEFLIESGIKVLHDDRAWSAERKDAHVFETFKSADDHARARREGGEDHVHAVVSGADDPQSQSAREARREAAVVTTAASVPEKKTATIPERMERARKSSRTRRGVKFRISGREAYDNFERQHLA